MTAPIKFDSRVPATLRDHLRPFADRVAEVITGNRRNGDSFTYMAYLRQDWSASDDLVFSVFGDSARELLREVKRAKYEAGSWGEGTE